MGRPKISDEPRVATAIRLPASLHGHLHEAATARDVSVNLLVTDAVSEYLQRLGRLEDPTTTELSPHRMGSPRSSGATS